MMTVREEQALCKLHEFFDANEQCVDLVAELVDTLCYK